MTRDYYDLQVLNLDTRTVPGEKYSEYRGYCIGKPPTDAEIANCVNEDQGVLYAVVHDNGEHGDGLVLEFNVTGRSVGRPSDVGVFLVELTEAQASILGTALVSAAAMRRAQANGGAR